MSFDIGDSFNHLADAVCRAPVIGPALASPIWAALLLTATAAVIVLAVYHTSVREALRGGAGSRAVRAFIYVFGAVAILTALHYRSAVATVGATATRTGFRDVVGAAEAARAGGSEFPVEGIPAAGGPAASGWPASEPVPNLAQMYGNIAADTTTTAVAVQGGAPPEAALGAALLSDTQSGPGVPQSMFARVPFDVRA